MNNLPPTMKEGAHYAAHVTWLTAKTNSNCMQSHNVGVHYLHIKDDVMWGIWKCQGQGWHVCLSVSRHLAQVTEDCQSGAMFKRKNGIIKTEETFCISAKLWWKWDNIWSLQPCLCNYSVPVLFFNLSNYLACLSFCFCFYSMSPFHHVLHNHLPF